MLYVQIMFKFGSHMYVHIECSVVRLNHVHSLVHVQICMYIHIECRDVRLNHVHFWFIHVCTY